LWDWSMQIPDIAGCRTRNQKKIGKERRELDVFRHL